MSAAFIDNFRRRALIFNVEHGDKELTVDTAKSLTNLKMDASNEFVNDLDDPIMIINLEKILKRSMISDDGIWIASQYLKS